MVRQALLLIRSALSQMDVSTRTSYVMPWRPPAERPAADIEAVKDGDGNIVGAVNCFQDITERKQAEAREKIGGREMDHRAKNLLSLVQATVQLTQAGTVSDFKAAIGGRLQALANAHSLLAESRWAGASLAVC
jgi:hypothetical protein